MFQNITYHLIFGLPVIAYGGLLTLVLLLSTAAVGYLIHHNLAKIPFYVHKTLAFSTVTIGLIHAIFAILLYF